MQEWNFDLSLAPKGSYVDVVINKKTIHTFVPRRIQTASACGKVIVSQWIPEAERWEFYTKDSPPIAWALLLEHPNKMLEAQ